MEAIKVLDLEPKGSRIEMVDGQVMPQQLTPVSSEEELRRGRWSQDEHETFLNGYYQFGRNWKRIALMIPMRNHIQVRTHAQKYFKKMNKRKRSNQNVQIMPVNALLADVYIPSLFGSVEPIRPDEFPAIQDITSSLAEEYEPLSPLYGFGSVYSEEEEMYFGTDMTVDANFQTPPILRGSVSPESPQLKLKEPLLGPPEEVIKVPSRGLSFSSDSQHSLKRKRSHFLEQHNYQMAERYHDVMDNSSDTFRPKET